MTMLVLLCFVSAGCDEATTTPMTGSTAVVADPVIAVSDASTPKSAASASGNSHAADLGQVSVDQGPVRLSHTFIVRNQSALTKKVQRISTSCGCVEAILSTTEIAPNQEASLDVMFELRNSGVSQQQATVYYEDGTCEVFALRAMGTRQSEFTVSPQRVVIKAPSDPLNLTFYVVNRTGRVVHEPPRIIAPNDASLEFTDWTTLEEYSPERGRPIRQMGSGRVRLAQWPPTAPTPVTLRLSTGEEVVVTVEGATDPS